MEKLLLRPSEAADILGLARAQVYVLCSRGVLPAIRIGRSVRLPVAGLREYVNALAGTQRGRKQKLGRPETTLGELEGSDTLP